MLLVAVRANVPEPIESTMTVLKAMSNSADISICKAVRFAKRCLIALREIEEVTRGLKVARAVLTMCGSSAEEKQAAKIAWGVKIAAKIVERKVAQKRNRDKPLVRLKAAKKRKTDSAKFGKDEEGNSNTPKNKKAHKQCEADGAKFGTDEEGHSNTPQNKKARKQCETDAAKFGKDEKGKSNTPKNKKARKQLEDHLLTELGTSFNFKKNENARKPERREKSRLLVEKKQLAAAHEASRRIFQHSIRKYGDL